MADAEGNTSTSSGAQQQVISNGDVFDWIAKVDFKNLDHYVALAAFKERFCLDFECHSLSMYNVLKKVNTKMTTLKKNKKTKQIQEYRQQQFTMPRKENPLERAISSTSSEKEKELTLKLHEEKRQNRSLKRKLESSSELKEEFDILQEAYYDGLEEMKNLRCETSEIIKRKDTDIVTVNKELLAVEKRYEKQRDELSKVEIKLDKCSGLQWKIRKLNKRISYRDAKMTTQKGTINAMKLATTTSDKEKEMLRKQVEHLTGKLSSCSEKLKAFNHEEALETLRKEKHTIQKQVLHVKKKLAESNLATCPEEIQKYEKEVSELDAKVASLVEENKELQKLVSLLEDHELVTFGDGRFTNEIREVVMELLSMNVSMRNVEKVIKSVLQKLAGIGTDRLPCLGSCSRFLEEALILAKMQVVREMQNSESSCLHGDGTSKYHRHYQNFQITTDSGRTLSFGLAEISCGDAASTLKCFTEAIDDLCLAIDSKDSEYDFAKLISSITTTMSDLGPVNPLFNTELQILREQLLPKVFENWETLPDEQKAKMGEMGNFFCKLHLLANFASESDKVLKGLEDVLLCDEFQQVFSFRTKESAAARLVRTACKAYHVRGSDEAGVAGYFNSFLSGRSEKSFLVPFIGNRFNILFYNGAAVYHHSDAMKGFFNQWPDPNNLLKAVNEDMSNNLFLAEIRALGIIDKLVTGPLWRLIENTENILALNPYLFRLKMRLSELCNDASSLLSGDTVFGDTDNIEHHKCKLWDTLFERTSEEFDTLTQQALEVILHAILIILERQCTDQLPGGKYWHASESIQNISKNVPTTNKASESDFAILDLLMRTKPNASVQAIQALTMWSRNQTSEWLNTLTDEDKSSLFDTARGNLMKIRETFKARKIELISKRKEKLLKKQNIKKDAEAKKNLKKIEAANKLQELGLRAWISIDEAEKCVNEIPLEERQTAILAQMDFYRHVIAVNCPAKLFNKTKVEDNKRVNIHFDDLLKNLKTMIKANLLPEDYVVAKSALKSAGERDSVVLLEKRELMLKIQNGRLKRICDQQKKVFLPKYLENPQLLVGKIVQHKVQEHVGDEEAWERGEVMSITTASAVPKKTKYGIKYDGEPDKIWSFPLLTDMSNGDLLVI